MVLQDIVSGAAFEGFDGKLLSHGVGYKDDREIGPILTNNGDGGLSVGGWQRIVLKNEVKAPSTELRLKIATVLHPGGHAGDVTSLQGGVDAPSIGGILFKMQDSQWYAHSSISFRAR